MVVVPLCFTPFLRPMVWGNQRLRAVLHKPLPTGESYGESWEVSDHALHRSVVAAGPLAGRSLRTLMETERTALLGPPAVSYSTFPWLVKFLDAADWLSVQVHPDEEAVRSLWPGEGSKTETWFVLAAEPGSRIYAGLLPGVDEERLRQALAAGTVAECLYQFEPRPGDSLFLPAGTVHAVGGGVLMAEVQQTSDATFRLFDWNRRDARGKSRQLHLEESLASIHWDQGPVEPVRVTDFPNTPDQRRRLVTCRYFHLDYVHAQTPFDCGGENRLEMLIIVSGVGRLAGPQGETEVCHGQVWVLPAALPRMACRPNPALGVLHCTLP
jgi:mannose-6-phosphate isomerase